MLLRASRAWLWRRWAGFWFEPAPAAALGVVRLLFFGALAAFFARRDFSELAEAPPEFWFPIPLFRLLDLPLLGRSELNLLQVAWKVALVFACLGLLTRASTLVAFLIGAYLLGLPHNLGKTDHNDAILVLVLATMALARCGDAWSLDRWLAGQRGRGGVPAPSGEYTWPIRLVWLLMALIFFGAGLAKLRHSGLEWIFSDNLATLLVKRQYGAGSDDVGRELAVQIARIEWLCQLAAAGVIAIELGYPLSLISRRARWIFVPGMLLMQVTIRELLGIKFDQMLICYLFWVPWHPVFGQLAAWLGRHRKPIVGVDDRGRLRTADG